MRHHTRWSLTSVGCVQWWPVECRGFRETAGLGVELVQGRTLLLTPPHEEETQGGTARLNQVGFAYTWASRTTGRLVVGQACTLEGLMHLRLSAR